MPGRPVQGATTSSGAEALAEGSLGCRGAGALTGRNDLVQAYESTGRRTGNATLASPAPGTRAQVRNVLGAMGGAAWAVPPIARAMPYAKTFNFAGNGPLLGPFSYIADRVQTVSAIWFRSPVWTLGVHPEDGVAVFGGSLQ